MVEDRLEPSPASGLLQEPYFNRIKVPRLKKDKKPITSVNVVNTTPPASAGSIFMRFKVIGTNTPARAAATKLIVIAAAITKPNFRS